MTYALSFIEIFSQMKKWLDHILGHLPWLSISQLLLQLSLLPLLLLVERDNSSDRQYFGRKSDGHRCLEPKKSTIWIVSFVYCSFSTGYTETDSNQRPWQRMFGCLNGALVRQCDRPRRGHKSLHNDALTLRLQRKTQILYACVSQTMTGILRWPSSS